MRNRNVIAAARTQSACRLRTIIVRREVVKRPTNPTTAKAIPNIKAR
jgi:hypothetical protein